MLLSFTFLLGLLPLHAVADDGSSHTVPYVSLGPRPFWLVNQMKDSSLKQELEACANEKTSYEVSDFSIGHRGACLQFPEHTLESYHAAALMGAGIIECDVTFTQDRQLICRHAQCDLHTTTDVVTRPELNAKCSVPFAGDGTAPKCCASDFTLEEIKTLCAKMDSSGGNDAATPEEYAFGGTADFRTDLYQESCPRIPTHKESIEFIGSLGGKFTPELKSPAVEMPYEGDYTQEMYAQQMIDEYIDMGIEPKNVWPQSFNDQDVFYWVTNTDFGGQAVALDESHVEDFSEWHATLVENGVSIVAPPLWMLVEPKESSVSRQRDSGVSALGLVGVSKYAESAKEHGLDIITWSLERSAPGPSGWYWQSLEPTLNSTLTDGDKLSLLHVLANDVGVLGVFSDWPATTTFFANCMNLGLREPDSDSESDPTSGSARSLSISVGGMVGWWY
eukprot:scaffold8694_cov135-Cylindrotheca_fusiformis.AAC.1